MKIGIIAEKFPPIVDGISVSVERIAMGLLDQNIDVCVATFDYQNFSDVKRMKPYVKKEFHKNRLNLYRIGPISEVMDLLKPGEMASERRNFTAFLEDICRKERFDILHAFFVVNSGFLSTFVSKRLNVPLIVSVRGNDVSRDIFNYNKFACIKWTLENATRITFVNSATYERTCDVFDIMDKSVVIRNSVQSSEITSLKKKGDDLAKTLKIPKDTKIIGYVGTLREKKGVQYLLEAFSQICEERNDITLLLVGDIIKPYDNRVFQDYIRDKKLANNVIITGFVPHEQVYLYLSIMDVICIPSIDDGMPNSLLEAMSIGKPVVASDFFSDILTSQKNALLFRTYDAKDLKNKILKILDNPDLGKRIGDMARALIKKDYKVGRECREYVQLYREILYE